MSRFEFKLPDIGEGVTEGEIVSWLVKEGDSVAENQDMVEVMTDKATVTIGAPQAGKVLERRGKEGDVVPVGQVLVVLEMGGAEASQSRAEPAPARSEPAKPEAARPAEPPRPKPREPQPAAASERAPERQAEAPPRAQQAGAAPREEQGPAASAVGDLRDVLPGMGVARPAKPVISDAGEGNGNGNYSNDHPLAAPATRKLARELGVDLHRVRPSGPAARITREDVERHHAQPRAVSSAKQQSGGADDASRSEPARTPVQTPPTPIGEQPADERVPIRGLRKRIFENMSRSKHTAAHFTYVDECDASALHELRERVRPHAERAGLKLSYLPIVVKAAVLALKKHPTLNAVLDEASNELVLRKTYDIGIAIATEPGLMVAVVRNAERLTILEIAREIERLSVAAREGKIRKEDLGGSSFTITSLGKLGGLFATPIVNYPEVSILGVHEIKRRPVVKDDKIVIGQVMLLSLSFDHRIIDGHVGAAFAHEIISLLEEPDRMLVELV